MKNPDCHFELVFTCNVLEHLEDPEAVFKEVVRVLKSGGLFISKTPNKWHYVPFVALITPHWFHKFINRFRGREYEDTYPTYYRVNTPGKVRYYANKSGMLVRKIMLIEGRPEYLRINAFLYLFGLLYERLVNINPRMSKFRVSMIAILEKP